MVISVPSFTEVCRARRPEQIVSNRVPYFEALDAADQAWKEGRVDVTKMEELLAGLLANQLMSIYKLAGGQVKHDRSEIGAASAKE
jgi:hypothetical protein